MNPKQIMFSLLVSLAIVLLALASVDPAAIAISTEPHNRPPSADAGENQSVRVGDTVFLDGSGSSDPDGDRLRYCWSFVSRPRGSNRRIRDAHRAQAGFLADRVGQYVVQLVVNDGRLDSEPSTVTITVEPCNSPPTANAGIDQTVTLGATVQLDGSASSDPDNDPLSFCWSFISRPYGSSAGLSNPFAPQPTFVADREGLYAVRLVVNDGRVNSQPDYVRITVEAHANNPPVAGDDAAATGEDTAITINVLSNDTDADGDVLTIAGVSMPANGSAVIEGNQIRYTPNTNFNGATSFTYTVSDGRGGADTAMVNVTVTPVNDAPDAVNDAASISENNSIIIDVLANDTDVDGNALTVSAVTQGANGTVINNGANVTYTPNGNFSGQDFGFHVSFRQLSL